MNIVYLQRYILSFLSQCKQCKRFDTYSKYNSCSICSSFYCNNCLFQMNSFYGFTETRLCNDCNESFIYVA